MATNTASDNERESNSGGSSRKSGRGSTSVKRAAASAVSADTVLDIVDRLGLIDLVIGKMRTRLDDIEFDDLFDEAGDYLRKNPDILVVVLAGITVTAGAVVFLQSRREQREEEERNERRTASARSSSGGGSSSSSGGSGGSRSSSSGTARRKA